MRLLTTITSYPPAIGGAQTYAQKLVQYLSGEHQIDVASYWRTNRTDWLLGTTLRAPVNLDDYADGSISVKQISWSAKDRVAMLPAVLLYYPLMDFALPSIANKLAVNLSRLSPKADLIYNIRIGREPLTMASQLLAHKRDIPFAFAPLHHPRWVGWLYRHYLNVYRTADLVTALTTAERDELIRLGVRYDRIVVTGMGPNLAGSANPDRFRKQHNIFAPFVLFVGQHYAYKGYRELLEAAPIVWNRKPETQFVFIGPAVGRSEDVFRANVDRRIIRLGGVSLEEKTDALSACDILCVPSTQESFGGVYTEAWSFSKPVIGAAIPAVSEVIDDGEDGFLVRQTPAEIADRLLVLLSDDALRQRLGVSGARKVESRYSWSAIVSRVDDAFCRLL